MTMLKLNGKEFPIKEFYKQMYQAMRTTRGNKDQNRKQSNEKSKRCIVNIYVD